MTTTANIVGARGGHRKVEAVTPGEAATRRWFPDEVDLERRIDAVESLGALQTICLDKTGTLTSGDLHLAPGVTLLGVRAFGVPVTPRDSRAAMHMWRYIGWLSGVREEWLAVTERDGLRKRRAPLLRHRRPRRHDLPGDDAALRHGGRL